MNEVKVKAKQYEPPAVVYESRLEVRAGSPLGLLPEGFEVLE